MVADPEDSRWRAFWLELVVSLIYLAVVIALAWVVSYFMVLT